MGVNSLPKTVTRQCRDCDLNPGPFAPESNTLTTRLPSHPCIKPNHYKWKNLDPIQVLSFNLLSAEFADQIFSTIAIVDPTQPNPWVNPAHGQPAAARKKSIALTAMLQYGGGVIAATYVITLINY